MESAIPQHLRVERRYPAVMPEGHQPLFTRHGLTIYLLSGQIVMACFGVEGGGSFLVTTF